MLLAPCDGRRAGTSFAFAKPITVTIYYTGGVSSTAAEMAPNLRLYSNGSWISAADTCLPPYGNGSWSQYDPSTRAYHVR